MNHTPARSLDQRMTALARANDVRMARAALKRVLKDNRDLRALELVLTGRAGELELADVDGAPIHPAAGYVDGAPVLALLVAAQGIGRVKANRMLAHVRVSPSKTVGGLTERQRLELLVELRELRNRRQTTDRLRYTRDRRRPPR